MNYGRRKSSPTTLCTGSGLGNTPTNNVECSEQRINLGCAPAVDLAMMIRSSVSPASPLFAP